MLQLMKPIVHPYYAGLVRWVEHQSEYTLASLARAAGLDNTTILHAIRKGNGPNSATIDKIGAVVGLTYEQVVAFTSDGRPFVAKPTSAGFSDSDVTPWVGQPDDGANVAGMAEMLAEGRGGRDIWRVNSRTMVLAGYVDGDFLLVDQHAAAEAGDVVIAQVYDFDVGSAATLLRRYDPPVLNAASTDPADWKTHVVDGRNVKIMGVVTASWRTG